jgi:methylenetetrahydrofolate dehydrogenase (NADP+)/methenyltetrahydrofolate cyclohydrolase
LIKVCPGRLLFFIHCLDIFLSACYDGSAFKPWKAIFTVMQLLDGKKVAQELYQKLQGEVITLQQKGIRPKLVIILVGKDPASLSYIKQKTKACEQIGIIGEVMNLNTDEVDTAKLVDLIYNLNKNAEVHGILMQLPLPKHVYAPEVLKAIDPKKDVDGFTAYNLGKMFISKEFEDLAPCTPSGIIKLLDYYKIDVYGRKVTMVGASNTVGKPTAIMLLHRGATVTICNSKTKDLASHTKRADILIVAVGKTKMISADMVKEGATVIDVGINRTEEGKLVGDTDFEALKEKVSAITPVPGGCGPMTVACLMENVIKAALREQQKT